MSGHLNGNRAFTPEIDKFSRGEGLEGALAQGFLLEFSSLVAAPVRVSNRAILSL